MLTNYSKILDTKDIFALNLDSYSGLDDLEYSKGLLWNFNYYLLNNDNNVNDLLGISKSTLEQLTVNSTNANLFNQVIEHISEQLLRDYPEFELCHS